MDELKNKGYDQIQEYIAPYWDSTKDGFYLIESGLTADDTRRLKKQALRFSLRPILQTQNYL